MSRERSFHDLYAHGMARVAAAVPLVKLADPAANAQEIARLYGHAADAGAALVVFPELSLTGYSIDDLVQQRALLDAAELALQEVAEATAQQNNQPGGATLGARVGLDAFSGQVPKPAPRKESSTGLPIVRRPGK